MENAAFLAPPLKAANTLMPIAVASKKQPATSHSTPEGELVAADYGVRMIGIPAIDIWNFVLEGNLGATV